MNQDEYNEAYDQGYKQGYDDAENEGGDEYAEGESNGRDDMRKAFEKEIYALVEYVKDILVMKKIGDYEKDIIHDILIGIEDLKNTE